MKAIELSAVIGGIRSKVDRSAGFNVSTPELLDDEFTELRKLQGQNVRMLITPMDETPEEVMKVEEEIESKPRHVRLRNALWVLWNYKFKEKYPDFDSFYRSKMDRLIEDIKEKI